jgi:hypothetical protein
MSATTEYAAQYETNGLEDATAYHSTDRKMQVTLDDPRLKTITRLRLLTDPGYPFWDLSYCHGALKDGTEVTVILPWYQFSKRNGLSREIVTMCKEVGVYGKGLGILDCISTVR